MLLLEVFVAIQLLSHEISVTRKKQDAQFYSYAKLQKIS